MSFKFFKDFIIPAITGGLGGFFTGGPSGAAGGALSGIFSGFNAPAQRSQQNNMSDMFSGFQQQQPTPDMFRSQMQGGSQSQQYSPFSGFNNAFSNMGSATQSAPEALTRSPQSTFGGGLGNANITMGQNISPELKQKLSGYYSGRTVF